MPPTEPAEPAEPAAITTPTLSPSLPAARKDTADRDAPLRAEVRYLGNELGEVLKRHGSVSLFDLVEEVRALSKARRSGDLDADARLHDKLAGLTLSELDDLIRALTVFFDLANLAEDRHRTRVLRQRENDLDPMPIGESLGAAIIDLKSMGIDAEGVQAMLNDLTIELVFTAHPTEAKRRTVRNTLKRLREDLSRAQRTDLLPRERRRFEQRIRTDLDCLWETDTLRPNRPTVLEEVRRSLFVIDSLWETVPMLYRAMRHALAMAYPGHGFELPVFLSFGSWIGGDRDGNPFVTADVTGETLGVLRQASIERHIERCRRLRSVLSISETRHPVSEALGQALEDAIEKWPHCKPVATKAQPREKYRRWLYVIQHRLEEAAMLAPLGKDTCRISGASAYRDVDELLDDLRLIQDSLYANGHHALADGELQEWIDCAAVFGFHLAQLDIREDAHRLREVVAELLAHIGRLPIGDGSDASTAFESLDETDRQALLTQRLDADAQKAVDARLNYKAGSQNAFSEATIEVIKLFDLLEMAAEELGPDALGMFITSMTSRPSDSLQVLWLARLAALRSGRDTPLAQLPIVPLFETIDDLQAAHRTTADLLDCEPYAQHVRATGNLQVCMVGYSDSTKDGGYLSGNWSLYQAQEAMTEAVRERGFELMIFHGRGGAIGRGGGPAAHSILSLPPHSVDGRIRITEQGEVLAQRYDDPLIALRHLEQVTYATMLVSTLNEKREAERQAAREARWDEALDAAAEAARKHYRALIEDPGFITYFEQATPISAIESMAIGSRPARRPSADEQRDLSKLRAIPYTFSWTQNRHMLTGFYGLGTGLNVAAKTLGDTAAQNGGEASDGWAMLAELYRGSPTFQATIDIAELALVKADLAISRAYAELCEERKVGTRIWRLLYEEVDLTRSAILKVTGRKELLAHIPWLKRSVQVRNPYVDPLNFIQVELMRRKAEGLAKTETARESAHHDSAIDELLRLSVQGIAAGLRTTG